MIVDFQLLNEDMITIGKARLNLPTENPDIVERALKGTGMAYTLCRFVKYDLYWQENGPKEWHGMLNIKQ